jgi:hypothetical protein
VVTVFRHGVIANAASAGSGVAQRFRPCIRPARCCQRRGVTPKGVMPSPQRAPPATDRRGIAHLGPRLPRGGDPHDPALHAPT